MSHTPEVSPDWRTLVRRYAQDRLVLLHESPYGVGLEFSDRSDAFWICPGEVFSTIEISDGAPVDTQSLLAEFERIDALRAKTLQALRHLVTQQGMYVHESHDGHWGLGTDFGGQELNVGGPLTEIVMGARDVFEVFDKWTDFTFRPSREAIEAARETHEPITPPKPSRVPHFVLSDILEGGLPGTPLPALDETAESGVTRHTHYWKQALQRLARLLPTTEAAFDLASEEILLSFSDGYDAFSVPVKSPASSFTFEQADSSQAGDRLAAQFLQLDRVRGNVLRTIWWAATRRGYGIDHIHRFPQPSLVCLGKELRDLVFDPGQHLTDLITTHDTAEALSHLFRDDPEFARECHEHLNVNEDPPALTSKRLLSQDTPPACPLLELDSEQIDEMTEWSIKRLKQWVQQRSALDRFHDRILYDPDKDRWPSASDWLDTADAYLRDNGMREEVIHLFVTLDESRGRELALQYIRNTILRDGTENLFGNRGVELAWRFRQDFSALREKLLGPFVDTATGYSPHDIDDVLADAGHPIAIRRCQLRPVDEDRLEFYDGINHHMIRSWSSNEQAKFREQLVQWALTTSKNPPDDKPLRLALQLGWQDVGEALEHNPYLVSNLLTSDERHDLGFDEPGLRVDDSVLLAWSLLSPSETLARLVLTARHYLLGSIDHRMYERLIDTPGMSQADVKRARQLLAHGDAELMGSLPIAWLRCLPALDERRPQPS